jgi:hypothetical protein
MPVSLLRINGAPVPYFNRGDHCHCRVLAEVELLARIRVLLRRGTPTPEFATIQVRRRNPRRRRAEL